MKLALLATMFDPVYRGPHVLGLGGFAGMIISLIILIVFCVILFKIWQLLAPKLGLDATWQQICYWLLVLLIFVWFLHIFGVY